MYRDRRLEGFDAAAVVEVIEHLDPPRLSAFERVIFEFARPATVVITTPNREYNVTWENVGTERLRHHDHRFEWTRPEFQMGRGHRQAIWLRSHVPAGRAGGRGIAWLADADGGIPSRLIHSGNTSSEIRKTILEPWTS